MDILASALLSVLRMAVIALVNQKGGCGKSSATVHLALWLKQHDFNVLVVDSDVQRSSSRWIDKLTAEIPTRILADANSILDNLPDLAEEYDHLIVDGPAGLAEVTRAVLLRSDLALIPCQPTGLDLDSAFDAIHLIQQAQSVRNGLPKAALFISRAVKGTKLKEEATHLLQKTGVPKLEAVIHQRQAIADSFGQASTVWGLSGRAAAESALEYKSLFSEAMEMLS